MAVYDEKFDVKKARNARINARLSGQAASNAATGHSGLNPDDAGTRKNPRRTPRPATPKPKGRGPGGRVVNSAKSALDFLTKSRTAPKIIRPVAKAALTGARAAISLPGTVGVGLGYAANKGYLDKGLQKLGITEEGNNFIQDDTEKAGSALADDVNRLLGGSHEQAVVDATTETPESEAYIRELIRAREAGEPMPEKPGAAGDSPGLANDPIAEDGQPVAEGPPALNDDGAARDFYLAADSQPAGPELNAGLTRPIPGSEYDYAGRYGDTDVLRRDTVPSGRPDGAVVPEFSDRDTAAGGLRRPQSQEAIAAEEARVQKAREDYERNTTGSDGRRYYGGAGGGRRRADGSVELGKSSSQQLNEARQAALGRGDTEGVGRSMAYEGMTPEQRAAYEADPSGAYAIDANADAAGAKAQLDAFKYGQDQIRKGRSDVRADRTEARRVRSAAMNEAGTTLAYLESDPRSQGQIMDLVAQAYDAGDGRESISSLVKRVMSVVEQEDGYPLLDEQGNIKLKEGPAETERPVAPYL